LIHWLVALNHQHVRDLFIKNPSSPTSCTIKSLLHIKALDRGIASHWVGIGCIDSTPMTNTTKYLWPLCASQVASFLVSSTSRTATTASDWTAAATATSWLLLLLTRLALGSLLLQSLLDNFVANGQVVDTRLDGGLSEQRFE
jgi:hypothetical protein